MNKFKAKKELMAELAGKPESKLPRFIKFGIVARKVLIVCMSDFGKLTLGILVNLIPAYFIFGYSFLGISIAITSALLAGWLSPKIDPALDFKESIKEMEYTLQLLRDIRDDKIEIEK